MVDQNWTGRLLTTNGLADGHHSDSVTPESNKITPEYHEIDLYIYNYIHIML